MKFSAVVSLLFAFGFIIFKGIEGYREGKNWKATYTINAENIVINSSDVNRLLEESKHYYLSQKNINEQELCQECIEIIEKLIVDNQISANRLFDELERIDRILDNPFLTAEGRNHFNELRETIADQFREYGRENPAFLENFNEAEIQMKEHRKFLLDPDVIKLQRILVEEGVENCCRFAKKMSETTEGKDKLKKLFGDSTMDGETFLDLFERTKINYE